MGQQGSTRRVPPRPDGAGLTASDSVMAARVLIADEHRGARENLRLLLERIPGFTVVGVAASVAEALAQASTREPDLVLLDAALLDATSTVGADPLLALGGLARPPRILLMTAVDHEIEAAQARALGASGTISKLAGRDSLLSAIRAALQETPRAPTAPPVQVSPSATVPSARIPMADADAPPPLTRGFALSLGAGAHDLAVETEEAHTWRFREALARWPSGVTVVTTREDVDAAGPVLGITVSSFCSLSLDPTLILIAIGEGQPILPTLLRRRFTVNILGAENADLAEHYARRAEQAIQPDFVEDEILLGSRAALVCSLWRDYPGGDHRILIGLVERIWLGPPSDPLLYARRAYRRLADDTGAAT